MSIHSSADNWRSLHSLPVGTILVDDAGEAYQIGSREHFPDQTWVNPVSDEYAFIVGNDGPGVYFKPTGNLTEIWRPANA